MERLVSDLRDALVDLTLANGSLIIHSPAYLHNRTPMNEQRDGMTESVDCQPAETYRFKPILPEDSVLTLEEYLAMQRTIGHSIAFRLLRLLIANEGLEIEALENAMSYNPDEFSARLDELIDVGLVTEQQRVDSHGIETYYRPTAIGKKILERGVAELMRRKHEFLEAYS
jgi:DNA-binding MarR family transcriptional regulator